VPPELAANASSPLRLAPDQVGRGHGQALALEARRIQAADPQTFRRKFLRVCRLLKQARPTAVNLAWAVDRVYAAVATDQDADVFALQRRVRQEADALAREDLQVNETLARIGAEIVPKGSRMLTYCNTGTLATGGHGTALGVIRTAFAADRSLRVFACETRPVLQGARLTSFELMAEGIPVTLITDNAAGALMARNGVDLVLVGADRIAANGDTANKIGTLEKAICAKEFGIPFYVAAPLSTFDPACKTGEEIVIEERHQEEMLYQSGPDETGIMRRILVAAPLSTALNPAFDVTPARYITGIITEKGIIRPSEETIYKLINP